MSYDDGYSVSGETMGVEEGSWDDDDTTTTGGVSGPTMTGGVGGMSVEGGSFDDEEEDDLGEVTAGGNSSATIWDMLNVEHNERTPVEIGLPGCFDNVLEKQQNPPTQNSKFLEYQVKKQENQAAATKLFAFGRFV